MTFKEHRYFLIGLLFASGSLIIFYIIGLNGWGGNINEICYNSQCFCEEMHPNEVILEPVNTWTNLYYMISGLIILWQVDKSASKKPEECENPMQYPSLFSILYGMLVIDIGVGSWLFHANMRTYGGIWDTGSMNAYMSFLLFYMLMRNWRKSTKWFMSGFLIVTFGLLVQSIIDIPPDFSVTLFTILVAITGSHELFASIWYYKKGSVKGLYRDWRLFIWGFGLFNFGFIIWGLTNTGCIWCYPQNFWQGHGFWHFFTAVATYFFFIYMRTEKKVIK